MVTKTITNNTIVSVCFIVCACVFLLGSSHAGELVLQLRTNHIELGQVIDAKLRAFDTEIALAEIDLAPLYEDFAVSLGGPVSDDLVAKVQTLNLKLHPRRTGDLTLPPLILGELHSPEQTVKVSNAVETGGVIVVDLKVSDYRVWQRQQIFVSVVIKSPERFFTVELEPFNMRGFEAQPFVLARESIEGDQHYRSRIQLGWAVFPLLEGEFNLELPVIRYLQGGRIQRRFSLPRVNIQVQELPAYIPPNMPVAEVSVESSVTEALLRTGNIAYWDITMSAVGTLTYWLPPVLHSVQSNNVIEFLPAKSKPTLHIDSHGTRAQLVHQVPFKAQRIGYVGLPELKIRYFDPGSGRIKTVYHQPKQLVAWNIPLILAVVVLLILPIRRVMKWGRNLLMHHEQKRAALLAVRKATTVHEVLVGLRFYAVAEGWPMNLTLTEFKKHWQQRYYFSKQFASVLQDLAWELYAGQAKHSLKELQQKLLRQLQHPHKTPYKKLFPHRFLNSVWDLKKIFMST